MDRDRVEKAHHFTLPMKSDTSGVYQELYWALPAPLDSVSSLFPQAPSVSAMPRPGLFLRLQRPVHWGPASLFPQLGAVFSNTSQLPHRFTVFIQTSALV